MAGPCPSPSHRLPTALLWRLQFFPISLFSCFRLLLSPSCSRSKIETSVGFLPEAAGGGHGDAGRAGSCRGRTPCEGRGSSGSGAELGAGRGLPGQCMFHVVHGPPFLVQVEELRPGGQGLSERMRGGVGLRLPQD